MDIILNTGECLLWDFLGPRSRPSCIGLCLSHDREQGQPPTAHRQTLVTPIRFCLGATIELHAKEGVQPTKCADFFLAFSEKAC